MMYPEIPLAQTLVRLCEAQKVQHIVICAGSRNAPLTNGFVANPYFTTYSIVDERAAAFFALGMSQQLTTLVAVVCTSGSALLNFYPAVAEAYYSDIPLIVISADRMPHRIDIGDGQTIRQNGVFEPHLEGAATLKPDVSHATATHLQNPMQTLLHPEASEAEIQTIQGGIQRHNTKGIKRVLDIAIHQQGPVHLNIPLEEPLYGMTNTPLNLAVDTQDSLVKNGNALNLAPFISKWQNATNKMVLIGVLPPSTLERQLLEKLCNDPSVIVLTETTSNVRHANAINSIDTLMAPLEQSGADFYTILQPQILLTFGGMVVSKKIKAFLRNHSPQEHWHVDVKKAYNTYYCLSEHLKITPAVFLNQLYDQKNSQLSSTYQRQVLEVYSDYKKLGRSYLAKIPFSDLKAFELIFKQLPDPLNLHLANSSTVRYAQLFELQKHTEVFCNRGTSGIDGSTATAIGSALHHKEQTLLITGDLSFFYDINGLWNNHIPASFRILLINNKGGGIFRILPGEKDTPKYDRYFETVHQRDAQYLAKAFNFNYKKVRTPWGLKTALKRFYKPSSQPKLLEIQTPRQLNDEVLLNYFKAMATKSINS